MGSIMPSPQTKKNTTAFTLVVLISGQGSNLKAIFEYITEHKLAITIRAVISNKASAKGLNIAQQFKSDAVFLDPSDYDNTEKYDQGLKQVIDQFNPDLIVLAGFMRILSEDFVTSYSGRMINIHPSLLPKHKGLNTHQKALDKKDAQHGCSIHYVSPELDGGPVITQASFPIDKTDNLDDLKAKTQHLEHRLLPLVILWISQKRIQLVNEELTIDPVILRHEIPILPDKKESI